MMVSEFRIHNAHLILSINTGSCGIRFEFDLF